MISLFVHTKVRRVLIASLFMLAGAIAQPVSAQSTDQSLPTPVLSNDLNGKISALDVGDPRATRHFYAFAASPGDLLITVDSKNLDGDVDVFTAITFRPLMKTTVYSTSRSAGVTKGIYLRAHQLLILRIEARTPNDDAGTYHIRFGGTFEPFSGGIPVAENTETVETTEKASANRLSSVGATLPKPSPEVTETAEAKPSPSPEKTSEPTESAKAEPEKSKATNSRSTTTRPPRRSNRPTTSRRQPPPKKTEPAKKPESETNAESKTELKVEPTKPDAGKIEKSMEEKPPVEKPPASTPPAEKSKPQDLAAQLPGTRLIIEEKDGTRIERPMSTVRRVVIEGASIVVILKNGKTERLAMADVARMAIEPQQ